MVENGCGHSGHGALKLLYLKNKLMVQTKFLHADMNSGKLKVTSVFG